MEIRESGEMYLETILILLKKNGSVRAIDVGEYMGYSKPSVSRAMGLLKESGYITVDPSGLIALTQPGREIAESVYERHNTVAAVLERLGVSRETALEDACKVEHYISDETFLAVKRWLQEHL